MKKILLLITILFATTMNANEHIKVITNNGFVCEGKMVKGNSNSIIVKANKHKYGADTLTFELKDIRRVILNGEDFVPYEDKLVAEKSLSSISLLSSSPIKYGYIDHSYATGKALKSVGGVALGVGIPCAAAGAALLVVANKANPNDVDAAIANARMATAGYVLLPVGASLTIVGIPLCIHGKKIMNMNFNYTGNGAGVALQF